MAFREDVEALHARNEELEKQLEDARHELRELRPIRAERDRLQAQLDALVPKKKPSPAPTHRPVRTKSGPARSVVVIALGVLVLLGAGVAYLVSRPASGPEAAAAENKQGDTRAPTIGVVDLVATPDPAPIPFSVTGTDAAPSPCRGYLPDAPQLVLRASTPTLVHITTRCNVDLVALVTGLPSGIVCDDDGGSGQQPLIEATLPAGDTRLLIGTYSEGVSASCESELHATALPADVDVHGLAISATPTLGTLLLDGSPTNEVGYRGTLGTELIDLQRVESGCPGMVSSLPELVVEVTEPSIVRVDASSDDADLVLMMASPDGTFTCDDDDGIGTSPRIAKRLPPGRYPVWVGSFSTAPAGTGFRVGARITTLASEAAAPVASTAIAIGETIHVTGQSDDELWAASMWSDCVVPGYVPYRPTHALQLASRGELAVTSNRGDLLIALTPHDRSTATIRPCTTEPSWRTTLDAGTYDLYVGTASGESTRSDIDLTIALTQPSVLPYTP